MIVDEKDYEALKAFMKNKDLLLEHNGKVCGVVTGVRFEGDNAILSTEKGETKVQMNHLVEILFKDETSVQFQTMGYELKPL